MENYHLCLDMPELFSHVPRNRTAQPNNSQFLGERPRVCVTTTPRNVKVLKDLLASPSTVQTHAPTEANRANLAASFLSEIEAQFGGTTQGRQEIEGLLIEDVEGALWTRAVLDAASVEAAPALDRIVVAVRNPMYPKGGILTSGLWGCSRQAIMLRRLNKLFPFVAIWQGITRCSLAPTLFLDKQVWCLRV